VSGEEVRLPLRLKAVLGKLEWWCHYLDFVSPYSELTSKGYAIRLSRRNVRNVNTSISQTTSSPAAHDDVKAPDACILWIQPAAERS